MPNDSWWLQAVETTQVAWPYVASFFVALSATLAAGHAIMTKQDEHAAVGWVGVICLVPALGPLLYLLLGINRIRRKAMTYANVRTLGRAVPEAAPVNHCQDAAVQPLGELCELVSRVTNRPLLAGNRIDILHHGDAAYPAMLAAIDGATRSIALCTYIFDHDAAGEAFRAALKRAVARGVQVRVLIDAVGSRYSWPPMARYLRQDRIPVARFGQTLWPWRMPYANLRNHRKILLVDGRVGFTGGMNIRLGHWLAQRPRHPIGDLHFRLGGPILRQLWEPFMQDWWFVTGEALTGDAWAIDDTPRGSVLARGVPEGPDENIDALHWMFQGALACARRSVYIVTPYFLPDRVLVAALQMAALRGLDVHVVLPKRNNLILVKWASNAHLPRLVQAGVHVHYVNTIFDHSKLMIVDDTWALIGSANWDPRSTRLNFEFNVECYDREFTAQLKGIVAAKLAQARLVAPEELRNQHIAVKFRDNLARLFSPYL